MSKHKPVSIRISTALATGKGLNLSPADVAEIGTEMASMVAVFQALSQQALQCSISPEACVALVVDCLCIDQGTVITVAVKPSEPIAIGFNDGSPPATGDTIIAAIDNHRDRCGREPLSGMKVVIPGSTILEQIMQSLHS